MAGTAAPPSGCAKARVIWPALPRISWAVLPSVASTGSTRASPSARRSRSSCVSSLRAWAMMRRMGQPSGGDDALLGDDEEDVLQRIGLFSRLPHPDALVRQPGRDLARGGLRVA